MTMKRALVAVAILFLPLISRAMDVPGCIYNTTLPTLTNGVAAYEQCDSSGRRLVSIAGANYVMSTANSTTAQLASNATFTGTVETVLNQPDASILLTTDQPGTLTVNQYIDAAGTRLTSATVFLVSANQPFERSLILNGNYINFTFQNTGSGTTTTLNLNVYYGTIQPGATTTQLVGGMTREVCVPLTVTASSAYTAGNEVGGLVTFTNAFGTLQSGVLQSVALNFKDAQTAEFDVTFFRSNPSSTTWTDKTTPSINAADTLKPMPTIKLTTASSVLGTHTVYGLDGIAGARLSGSTSAYAIMTTPGTPTFGSTSDAQLCATFFGDN